MQDKKIAEISRKTGISIKELNRLNNNLWYHGTTIVDAKSIIENGVNALYNVDSCLDFGPGFYLTPSLELAENYISRVPLYLKDGSMVKRESWGILKFEFNPFELIFNSDSNYTYRNFPKHNEEFAEFVFRNRVYNQSNENPHGYDFIWGVMTDAIPDEIIKDYNNDLITYEQAIQALTKSNSMKQLYISNQNICNMLKPIMEKEVKQNEQ